MLFSRTKFAVFLLILIVGYLIAKAIAMILSKVLTRVGFDRLVERGGVKRALDRSSYDASGIHLRAARAQGHLPARTRQNPGRRDDQPGDIRRSNGEIWGMGRVRGPSTPKANA